MANTGRTGSHSGDEVSLEIDDSQTVKHLGDSHETPILVLSRDAALVDTVKKAAPRGTTVTSAPDLDQVAEKLPTLKPGVLIADTASTADVAALVTQLTQHFPELVVVVCGKKEDSAALMQLTAAGRIFRFLLTPISHGQTRLALEAAVKQHADLAAAGQRIDSAAAASGSSSPGKNYIVTYGALGGGLLVVIGLIWFGMSQLTKEPEAPSAQTQSPATQSAIPEKQDPVQAELAMAKEAFDQGKYLEPPGESALDYYRSALALDPNSEAAKAGIRSVVDKVLQGAEESLLAERLEEAVRNIERARDIDPTHPRLQFFDTQLTRERERLKLTQAQEVGTRVRQLVSQANERMQNGRLIAPANANARDALLEARRLDPTDPTVAQAIRELSSLLADQAREALNNGRNDEAQALVNAGRQLGSAGAALGAVERALADANRAGSAARRPAPAAPTPAAPAVDPLVADIRQRMSEGRLIEPAGDSARDLLLKLRSSGNSRAEMEELSRTLGARLLNSGRQALNAKAYDRSEQFLTAAREVGGAYLGPELATAETELSAARQQSSAENNVVSASTLKRTRTVNPSYPDSALKKGIEGWVELAFTVQPNGTVDDVQVRNSSPAEVFDDAATRAVRQWRFEPVLRNGAPVAQRAMVRLRFTKPQ